MPTAAQVQKLIDLLTEVLQQARTAEMAEAIKAFSAGLEAILAQLGRLSEDLARVIPAASAPDPLALLPHHREGL